MCNSVLQCINANNLSFSRLLFATFYPLFHLFLSDGFLGGSRVYFALQFGCQSSTCLRFYLN